MKRMLPIVLIICLSMCFVSCAPAPEFKSEADERLFRSIESGGDISDVIESVADGASIDRLKRGRFVSLNMVEFAAGTGQTEIAAWLINNGADVNYKTSIMGETLLMSMAACGSYELCKLLIEKGADIAAADRLSDTALEYAFKAPNGVAESEIDKIITLLLSNGAEFRRETLTAAQSGYSGKGGGDGRYALVRRVVIALRQSGIDTKLRPATVAAILGDGESVIKLLGEEQDGGGQEPLFYTAAFGSDDTLKKLRDMGISLSAKDGEGNTLLITAVRYGNKPVVMYLLEAEPSQYGEKNSYGKTARDIAAEQGNVEIAQLLEANMPALEAGAFGSGNQHCCCSCQCGES